ncbi:GTP-binding protein Era, partial [Candidatus Methanophagaceae archaeon]
DKFKKGKILEKIELLKEVFPWKEIVPISALNKVNIDLLEGLIYKNLPETEHQFFNDDEFTRQSEKFYVSEIIREKILNYTKDELPYTTFVRTDEITDRGNVIYVRSDIHVESNSQKKIVIGKQGNLIKKMGESARADLEEYFEKKVFIELFVKVIPNWRNSQHIIKEIFE